VKALLVACALLAGCDVTHVVVTGPVQVHVSPECVGAIIEKQKK